MNNKSSEEEILLFLKIITMIGGVKGLRGYKNHNFIISKTLKTGIVHSYIYETEHTQC